MDDMDSLFDGMVLFTPSSSSSELPAVPPPPAVDNNNKTSDPIDENLFSDLTLNPISPLDIINPPVSPSSSQPVNRSSTRKKKKAGSRIGYGRKDIDIDELPASSLPVLVSEEKNGIVLDNVIGSEVVMDNVISAGLNVAEAVRLVDRENENVADNVISTETNVVEAVSENETNLGEEEVKEVEGKEDLHESRYEQIKKQIQEKVTSAKEQVALVSMKRKEFIKRRRKAVEELNFASQRYKEMEKELEEAIQTEDFETAERVSDGLASAEKDKEVLLSVLREVEAECDAVEVKMQKALEMQIVAEEECAGLLASFAVDADHDADAIISNAETKTSEETEKWLSLSEALEVKKIEVEIHSHVISGARQVLDDSIEHVVKDDKEESELLHKKKNMLAEELQELLALVKQKEAEIAENDSKIEMVEKKMADAVSSFQEAQSNIHSKTDTLQSSLSQLELENDSLTRKKNEIDDFLLQEEARGSKIRELGQISADEAGTYQETINLRKSLIEFISKSREDKIRLAKTEQNLFDDVQMLKQDISAVRASLQDLSSTKSGTQQAIESSNQRLLFIDKRVPKIESEKRVAATARNFKEAARIANETKALYVEKETLQTKIEEATTELKKIEDEINQNVEKLQGKEDNISAMEKELETVRYQRLILIAGAATAERSAALQLGDHEEADILLKEAQTADYEARKIQPSSKEEEFDSLPNSFISMELVSTLDKTQLAELAASTQIAAP